VGFDPADLIGMLVVAAVGSIVYGSEHDHPAAGEREFGVHDGIVGTRIYCVFLKSKNAAQPFDGGGAIAIGHAGDDGATGILSHADRLPEIGFVLQKSELVCLSRDHSQGNL